MGSFIEMDRQYVQQTLVQRSASEHIFSAVTAKHGPIRLKCEYFPTAASRNSSYQRCSLQKLLTHPFIPRVFHRSISDSPLHSLQTESEWPGECLLVHSCARSCRNEGWKEDEVALMLSSTVEALSYAQKLGVSHGNVTPQSVCFKGEPDFSFHITDFWGRMGGEGNPVFFSPERRLLHCQTVLGEEHLECTWNLYKSDVYSLGLVALYMIDPRQVEEFGDAKVVVAAITKLSGSERLKTVLKSMLAESEALRSDFVQLEQPAKRLKDECFLEMTNRMLQGSAEYWTYAVWYLLCLSSKVQLTVTHPGAPGYSPAALGTASKKRRLIKKSSSEEIPATIPCRVCRSPFTPNFTWLQAMQACSDRDSVCSPQCYGRLCAVCHNCSPTYFYQHCRKHVVCHEHYQLPTLRPSLFAVCPQCDEPKTTEMRLGGLVLEKNDCDEGVVFMRRHGERSGLVPIAMEVVSALENSACHFCGGQLRDLWLVIVHGEAPAFVCSKDCRSVKEAAQNTACPACQQPMDCTAFEHSLAELSVRSLALPPREDRCSFCRLRVPNLTLKCKHALCGECLRNFSDKSCGTDFPCLRCGQGHQKRDFSTLLESLGVL